MRSSAAPLSRAVAAADRPVVRTRPIPDPTSLLRLLPEDAALTAWVRAGEGLVGWGVAAELQVRGHERFARTRRWWNAWCESAIVDDTVMVAGSGPVAFGSFTFDPDAWSSAVIVPEVLIGRRGGQAWMTVIERQGHAGAERPDLAAVTDPRAPESVTWPRCLEDAAGAHEPQ